MSSMIAATGAVGAAAIVARSARRQASAHNASQENQWQRERRRESYSAFLDAGVQARDEFAAAWRIFKVSGQDTAAVRTRLESAYPLIVSVQRASATIHVTGPESILDPTKQAEENIVVFYRLLLTTIREHEKGYDVKGSLSLCARQESRVRYLLERFSTSAREVLNEEDPKREPARMRPVVPAEEELAWLKNEIAEMLNLQVESIDVKRSLFEAGLDSLALVKCFVKAETEFSLHGTEGWSISCLLFNDSIEEVACYIAELRRRGDVLRRRGFRRRAG